MANGHPGERRMSFLKRIRSTLEHLSHVEQPDPIQALRGRLLNVLLLGTVALSLVLVLICVVFGPGTGRNAEAQRLLVFTLAYLVLAVGLFAANRTGHTRPAAFLFLATFTVVTFFGDVPQQVVGGRSTFLFTLPIILASVLVCPSASFVLAALVSLGTYTMSRSYALEPVLAPTTVMGFFLAALVGWLAASSLEDALVIQARQAEDLRRMNEELDQRVDERTAELAMANERMKELDRMRTEFLSTAAHELRAPLTVIVGFSELLVTRRALSSNEQ